MDRVKEIFGYFMAAMAIFSLLCAVYEAMNQRLGSSGVLSAIFVACGFLLYLPQLDTFKAFGIEARMQNTLNRVEVSLQQLQKMAVAFASANLSEMTISGQMLSRLETNYKFELHDKIVASLRAVQVSDDDLAKAQEGWISVYCSMLLDSIEGKLNELLPNTGAADAIEALPKDSTHTLPSPKAVKDWVSSKSLSDQYLNRLLSAYTSVWETGSTTDTQLIPFNQALRTRKPN
jgi:hypothetical protein